MNNREKRRKIAEDTLAILDAGYYTSPTGKRVDIAAVQAQAEAGTKLYTPEASDELLQGHTYPEALEHPTRFSVINETTLNAVRALVDEGVDKVLCLNFASARNAGGGFLGGSQAQEESIARSTGLYNCQQKTPDYYEINRATKSCVYTDHMIYSPAVPIIKDEEGNNLEELVTCAVITAPAVNTGVVKNREPERMPEIEGIMKRRIRKVLAIALDNAHRNIVLGAWGCGVFQNDPQDIARYFREVLEEDVFKQRFERVVFAIYARQDRFINPFLKEFGAA